MADGPSAEIIGKIGVSIGADYSDFVAQAQAGNQLAAEAGAQMASSFNTAAAGADTLTEAAEGASAAEEKLAESAEVVATAHGHAVTQIQAASGALRVLEGSGGIRAAERFITLIPGIGAALQVAFPLVGLIAVGELIDRLVERFNKVSEAEKEAQKQTESIDREVKHLAEDIARTDLEKFEIKFGSIAAKAKESADAMNTAGLAMARLQQIDLGGELKSKESQAAAERDKLNLMQRQHLTASPEYAETYRHLQETLAAIGQIRSQLHEAETEITDIQDRSSLSAMKSLQGSGDQYQKQQNEKLQAAKAAAEAVKREKELEQENLRNGGQTSFDELRADHQLTTEEEISFWQQRLQLVDKFGSQYASLKVDYQNKIGELTQRQDKENQEDLAKAAQYAQETTDIYGKMWEDEKNLNAKFLEEKIRFDAEKSKKLVPTDRQVRGTGEAQIGANPTGTLSVQEQLNAAHIETVSQLNEQIGQDERLLEILQAQNAPLGEQLQLEQKITEESLKRLALTNPMKAQIGGELLKEIGTEQSPGGIASGLGSAIAKGVMDGGKGIGREVEQSLKNVGQQILGTVLTSSIQHLISTIVVQTGLQTALNAWLSIGNASQVANTAAVALNTAALVVNTTGMAVLVGALAANTAALIANSISNAFAGLAEGGDSPVGVPYWVGENGPELRFDTKPGTIMPNAQSKEFTQAMTPRGAPGPSSYTPSVSAPNGPPSSSIAHNSQTIGEINFHAHGMTNPRQFMQEVARQLPNYLRSTSPSYSPASQ